MTHHYGLLKLCRLCAFLVFILQSAQTLADKDKPADVTLAPAWELKDLGGKSVSLGNYKGKVVVLNFWATWCTPCLKEIPDFVAVQQHNADKGLVIIGAAMDQDDNAGVKAFAKKFFVNYPIVIAPSSMSHDYGVIGAPTTFIIDKNGFIVFRHVGALSRKDLAQQLAPLL